jgi:type I restriction enzyme S subunit
MKYQTYPAYKDSDVEWLGEVPEHWNARQLKFLCSCNDEVLSDSVNPDYEIEYVDIGSVSAVEGIAKTENMTFANSPSRARRIVRDGDVIISIVRTYLEAIAPVDNPPENLIVSTGFAVIRPNKFLQKGYAAYCLRANGFIKEVVARSVGISYPAINASDLVNIKTPEPSFPEQQKIAQFLDHETAKIDTLIEKLVGSSLIGQSKDGKSMVALLQERRTALISAAVTGKIDVRNWNAPNA